MSDLRVLAAGLILWSVAAIVSSMGMAAAHPANTYYSGFKWQAGSRTVPWKFTDGIANANIRSRVKDGATDWNQLGEGVSFNFLNGEADYAQFDGFSCAANRPFQKDAIHWQSYSNNNKPDGLGYTFKCSFDGSNIHDLQIVFNSDRGSQYYYGSGTPPNGQFDSWGIMTHEFGHATGWTLEIPTGDGACDGQWADRATMCDFFGFGLEDAKTFRRNPAPHDSHTFAAAY